MSTLTEMPAERTPLPRPTYILATKLASYFKIPKRAVIEQLGDVQNTMVIHFSSFQEGQINFNRYFYTWAAEKAEQFKALRKPEKFLKGEWMEQYLRGLGAMTPNLVHRYAMAIQQKGVLWLMYQATGYAGVGGLYFSFPKNEFLTQPGMVVEPVENWLSANYPH